MSQQLSKINLTKDQEVWLRAIYSKLQNNEQIDARSIRAELFNKLPRNFNPSEIDSRLLRGDVNITILGIALVDPQSTLVEQTNSVLDCVRGILLKDPNVGTITVDQVSAITSISKGKVAEIFERLSYPGIFHSSGTTYAENGVRLGWESINIDEKAFNGFVSVESIEKFLETFLDSNNTSNDVPQPNNSPSQETEVRSNQGAVYARRGFLFQRYGLLLYMLMRLAEDPNLELIIEPGEGADAKFIYPSIKSEQGQPVVEFVDFKKKERASSAATRDSNIASDAWTEGTVSLSDLNNWIENRLSNVSIANYLETHVLSYYTIAYFGNISKAAVGFIPQELSISINTQDFLSEVPKWFPILYEHRYDPLSASRNVKIGTENIRRRIRLIRLGSPELIEAQCRIILENTYGVAGSQSSEVFNWLLSEISRREVSVNELDRRLSAGSIEAIIRGNYSVVQQVELNSQLTPTDGDGTSSIASETISESILTASVSDQPTADDSLGFAPYIKAIAEFLTNHNTKPPLTLSIEGEWGSGKSSFMLQLADVLRGPSLKERLKNVSSKRKEQNYGLKATLTSVKEALLEKRGLIIKFNAWRHDKEDALWAAFALEFIRQISQNRFFLRRWYGHLKLRLNRYSWREGWLDLVRAIAVWIFFLCTTITLPLFLYFKGFGWAASISESVTQAVNNDKDVWQAIIKWLINSGGIAVSIVLLVTLWWKANSYIGSPVSIDLKKYLNSPSYEGHVAFIESFHRDFKDIVSAYAGTNKVFVFIDDLDRCEVPKAADLMQAINLMISNDPQLIFIIGMDREKVAAGIAVKHEKLIPYLTPSVAMVSASKQPKAEPSPKSGFDPSTGLEFGYSFIEKFIQLPFRVPEPGYSELKWFLKKISNADRAKRKKEVTNFTQSGSEVVQQQTTSTPFLQQDILPTDERTSSDAEQAISNERLPSEGQLKYRERLKLEVTEDSQTIQDITLMVAPALNNNPRRIKQFINLFRLRTFIASETGLFDAGGDEIPDEVLTLQRLGKFVAIELRWPRLLSDLGTDHTLLTTLQQLSVGNELNEDEINSTLQRWADRKELSQLLSYGCVDNKQPYNMKAYSLNSIQVSKLLQISPPVPKPMSQPLSEEEDNQAHTI